MRDNLPDLEIYYREKAAQLRRKADRTRGTARAWLIEAANECELRAISLELEARRTAFETQSPGLEATLL